MNKCKRSGSAGVLAEGEGGFVFPPSAIDIGSMGRADNIIEYFLGGGIRFKVRGRRRRKDDKLMESE